MAVEIKRAQRYFDQDARLYRTYSLRDDPESDRLAEAWVSRRLSELPPCDVIIDAGCGAGRWFGRFPRHRRLVAIDGARSMLETISAGARILDDSSASLSDPDAHDGPILVHGDLERVLPRLAGTADLVFAYLSLPENDEPAGILRLIHASLKPGGRALIVTNVLLGPGGPPIGDADIGQPGAADTLGSWSAFPVNPFAVGGARYSLYILVHVADGILPIVDKAHVPSDYIDSERWHVHDVCVAPWSGQVLVDGNDTESLRTFFPNHDYARALSLRRTGAVVAHLCLGLVKR